MKISLRTQLSSTQRLYPQGRKKILLINWMKSFQQNKLFRFLDRCFHAKTVKRLYPNSEKLLRCNIFINKHSYASVAPYKLMLNFPVALWR